EYKKFNGGEPGHRDIETLTEEELFATLDSSGYVRLSFRTKPLTDSSNKRSIAVSTDSDVPFVKNCVNSYNNIGQKGRKGEPICRSVSGLSKRWPHLNSEAPGGHTRRQKVAETTA
ncbi:unnamed protein product, partial [Oppiella nova]